MKICVLVGGKMGLGECGVRNIIGFLYPPLHFTSMEEERLGLIFSLFFTIIFLSPGGEKKLLYLLCLFSFCGAMSIMEVYSNLVMRRASLSIFRYVNERHTFALVRFGKSRKSDHGIAHHPALTDC